MGNQLTSDVLLDQFTDLLTDKDRRYYAEHTRRKGRGLLPGTLAP